MTADWFGGRLVVLGAALAISAPLTVHTAEAGRARSGYYTRSPVAAIHAGIASSRAYSGQWSRYGRAGGGLQCVPFARENTGIELTGNANTWWDNADGVYQRGAKPEVGSVLTFRATGRMRLGHVAVVSNVIDGRSIEIDHANWAGAGAGAGRVSRDITVVDVSPNNDWSAVRVAIGHTDAYGSVYPTYGFIYDRPDHGTMLANSGSTATAVLNPAPHDLRTADQRLAPVAATETEEVAEAADDPLPRAGRRFARHARASVHPGIGRASVWRVGSHNSLGRPQHRRHRF